MSRLFHSLVVCGAGLTLLDCGGRYAAREQAEPGGNAGSGGNGSGASSGGSNSASGAGGNSAGGLLLEGFSGTLASSGAGAAGGAVALPTDSNHWHCGPDELGGCTQGLHEGYPVTGFNITAPCEIDPTRPASPSDCAAGQSFDCLVGFIEDRTVLFNCQCDDTSLRGTCACRALPAGSGFYDTAPHYCDEQRSVCGCAYTGILK